MPGVHWRVGAASPRSRPGVILDRDGVLVEFVDYLHSPGQTQLAEGASELISRIKPAGVAVGVITNQAGIARSLYDWQDYFAVEEEIDRQLAGTGSELDGVVACPYHPDFTENWGEEHSYWRKPGPGMIELLLERLNIERERCWLIGDHITDVQAAVAAGLPGSMLVQKGHGVRYRDEALGLANPSFEVLVIETIKQATTILMDRFGIK